MLSSVKSNFFLMVLGPLNGPYRDKGGCEAACGRSACLSLEGNSESMGQEVPI